MDVHSQCKCIVRAARRPLSYAELSGAVVCTDSSRILGEDLEVSGGLRPIVHFKEMTALGGDTMDHNVTAQCCLRTLNHGYLSLDQDPFLRYAIEFIMKHADSAGISMHARFEEEFDYVKWQLWAVHLPVYAALNTYSFGGAMLRLKCFHLFEYIASHDKPKLDEGIPGSRLHDGRLRYSFLPWRGDFETRRQQRQQQRDLLLGVGPSKWTPWDNPKRSAATMPAVGEGWSSVPRPNASSSRRPSNPSAESTLSLTPSSPEPMVSTLAVDVLPTPISPTMSSFSFEDISVPPSEAGLSDFEMLDMDDVDLPWEDIEYQEAILASLQQGKEIASR